MYFQLATLAEETPVHLPEKRKASPVSDEIVESKKPKLNTKDLKATRPGFSEERYEETSYYIENGKQKIALSIRSA